MRTRVFAKALLFVGIAALGLIITVLGYRLDNLNGKYRVLVKNYEDLSGKRDVVTNERNILSDRINELTSIDFLGGPQKVVWNKKAKCFEEKLMVEGKNAKQRCEYLSTQWTIVEKDGGIDLYNKEPDGEWMLVEHNLPVFEGERDWKIEGFLADGELVVSSNSEIRSVYAGRVIANYLNFSLTERCRMGVWLKSSTECINISGPTEESRFFPEIEKPVFVGEEDPYF